jgi:YbbR domain-containing protein
VNVPIAIASLATAMLLFMIAMPGWMITKQSRDFYVTLDYNHDTLPPHFFVVKQPATIHVKATVSDAEYQDYTKTAKAWANLSTAKPGEKSYPVSLEPAVFYHAVDDLNLQATFNLEKARPREVPVFATSSGKLSDPSVIVDKLVSDTNKAHIEGRAADMAKVDHVRATLRLDTLSITPNQQISAPLDPVDENEHVVENVSVSPAVVFVTPEFSLAPQTKQVFVDVAFGTGRVPPGFEVKTYSVDPTHVTASGSSKSLAGIARVATETIDVTGMTQTQTFNVRLRSPGSDVKLNPSTVEVTIVVAPVSVKSLNPSSPTNPKPGRSRSGSLRTGR